MIWFMFLCFLFGKGLTQDECKKPEDVPEANIERVKDRDKTSFPHNTKLLFACKPGRRMSGESAERKCDNGKWTDVKFTCEMGSCRYIATPQNGRRLDQNYWPGQMTVFECNHGYRMVGNSRLMCMTNWEWDPEEPPKCETVKCPSRGSYLRNGEARPTFFNGVRNGYKTVIRYSCDDGYKLEGMQTQQCLGTGRWEGEDPKCVKLNCPDLGVLKNGLIDYENPNRGIFSMAYYECNADSDLFLKSRLAKDNEGERECQMNEQWDGQSELQCYKKCINKDLIDVLNSDPSQRMHRFKTSKHLEKSRLRCINKHEVWDNDTNTYKDANDERMTCENGKWNPKSDSLACVPKRCSVNDVKPLNVSQVLTKTGDDLYQSLKDNKVEHGTMVYMNCTVGYDIKSNDGKTLSMANGQCIEGTLSMSFTCQPKKCQNKELIDIPNSDPSQRLTRNRASNHLEETRLRCDDKHEVLKKNTYIGATDVKVTCNFGKWIPKSDSLACVPKRCSVDDVKPSKVSQVLTMTGDDLYQSLKENMVKHGTMVYMNCTVGYDIKSNDGKTLSMANGQCIKGTLDMSFTCQPKKCSNKDLPKIPKSKAAKGDFSNHKAKIVLPCYNKHEVWDNDTKTYKDVTDVKVTCDFGKWIPKRDSLACVPKRCILNVHDNSKYWYTHGENIDPIPKQISIEHGMNVYTECKDGYILNNTQGQTSDTNQTAQCDFGIWKNAYLCTEKNCPLPLFNNGTIQNKKGAVVYEDVRDATKITFECNDKPRYDLLTWDNETVSSFEATCRLGNWSKQIPKCHPKKCILNVRENSKYWYTNGKKIDPIPKQISIEHGMNVSTECDDGYILDNTQGQTSDTSQTARCNFGIWQNPYLCTENFYDSFKGTLSLPFNCQTKSCKIPNVKNGTKFTMTGHQQYVKHNTQLTIKCDTNYEILSNDGKAYDKLNTTCDKGNWTEKDIICKPKRCKLVVNNKASEFWIKTDGSQRILITEETKIKHDVEVNVQCINDSYNLVSTNDSNKIGGNIETAVCNYGIWDNAYNCSRRECKLSFTNGTINVTVNKQERTTGVLYEDETAEVKCSSGLEMFDSSGNIFKHRFYTTCRNNTLTKSLPFCMGKCSLTKSSKRQTLRVKNNRPIINRKLVRHGIKVRVQCNDGCDYKTDGVDNTTVYECINTRWIPPLPVCERKTINTDSPESSTTDPPDVDGRLTKLTTKRQDVVNNATHVTDLPTKSTSADTEVQPTVKGCVIDGKNRYVFYDKSEQDLRTKLENGAVVGPDITVYVECLTNDYIDIYDINEEWHVTCSGNTLTQIPDGLQCTEDCEYTVTNGELRRGGGGYKLHCNNGYISNLQDDSVLVICKDGKLESEYGRNPECKQVPCSMPTDVKRINITQEGVLIRRKTIKHMETVTVLCGNKMEPQGREFKCDNGNWTAEDDDKDWNFANNGTFPQCRNAKCKANCSSHGNCVKDNVCDCYAGYTGSICDTVDCDDKCQTNGGICQLPNNCTCNGTRYGYNCKLSWCTGPQTNAIILNQKEKYFIHDKLNLTCPGDMQLSSEKEVECKGDGEWSHNVSCVPKQFNVVRLLSYPGNNLVKSIVDSISLHIVGEADKVINVAIKWSDNEIATSHVHDFDIGKIKRMKLKATFKPNLIKYYWLRAEWLSIFLRKRNEYCGWEWDNKWISSNEMLTMENNGACSTFKDKEAVLVQNYHKKEGSHFTVRDDIECKLICVKNNACAGVVIEFKYRDHKCYLFENIDSTNFGDKSLINNWNIFLYRKK